MHVLLRKNQRHFSRLAFTIKRESGASLSLPTLLWLRRKSARAVADSAHHRDGGFREGISTRIAHAE
jgi:hypothetical protein